MNSATFRNTFGWLSESVAIGSCYWLVGFWSCIFVTFDRIEINKYTNSQIKNVTNARPPIPPDHKSTNPQIHKSTNQQVRKFTNQQIHKIIKQQSTNPQNLKIQQGGPSMNQITVHVYFIHGRIINKLWWKFCYIQAYSLKSLEFYYMEVHDKYLNL